MYIKKNPENKLPTFRNVSGFFDKNQDLVSLPIQEMFCLQQGKYLIWAETCTNFLFGPPEMFCLEFDWNTQMFCLEHRKFLACNAGNVVHGTREMFFMEHKEFLVWSTGNGVPGIFALHGRI